MKAPRVAVSFEGKLLGLGVVKTVADLRREVESNFKLEEGAYDICDKHGRVEGEALERALQKAGSNWPCELEVLERPQWRKMRQLEKRIEAIVAGDLSLEVVKVSERSEWQKMRQLEARVEFLADRSVGVEALDCVEEQVLGKVEGMVAAVMARMAQVEAKVDHGLAPLVQSVALRQIDIEVKVDDSIAPLMQSVALGQLELQTKLEGLDGMVAKLQELEAASAQLGSIDGVMAKLEGFDSAALVSKVDALEERVAANVARLVKKEARGTRGPSAMELDLGSPLASEQKEAKVSAMELDLASQPESPPSSSRMQMRPLQLGKCKLRVTSDGSVQLSPGCDKASSPSGKTSKSRRRVSEAQEGAAEWGDAFSVPFPRLGAKLERLPMSRSAPVLPPMF